MTDEEQDVLTQVVEVLRINTDNIAKLSDNVDRLISLLSPSPRVGEGGPS